MYASAHDRVFGIGLKRDMARIDFGIGVVVDSTTSANEFVLVSF